HQMMELQPDVCQIREDVGMIIFQIVQHQGARPVMDKLRALVEKGGVVFIRLDHETAPGARRRRAAEIGRYAADQKPGRQPGMFQDVRQHACRGGLAVRATASTWRPGRMFSASHCGPETYARPASSTYSTQALPRLMALPTTT